MNKRISNVSFINAVQAPPYVNGEISLNIQKRRDLEMHWDGSSLLVRCAIGNTYGEVIIPAGNIKSMAVLGTSSEEEGV